MDKTLNYADILTKVLRAEEQFQPSFVPVKIVPVCDSVSGQFLLMAVGWEGRRRVDNLLFHAQLMGHQIVIETDNIEDGLTPALIEAGVRAEDIVSARQYASPQAELLAA